MLYFVGNGVSSLFSKHWMRCILIRVWLNVSVFASWRNARAVATAIANNPQSYPPSCIFESLPSEQGAMIPEKASAHLLLFLGQGSCIQNCIHSLCWSLSWLLMPQSSDHLENERLATLLVASLIDKEYSAVYSEKEIGVSGYGVQSWYANHSVSFRYW